MTRPYKAYAYGLEHAIMGFDVGWFHHGLPSKRWDRAYKAGLEDGKELLKTYETLRRDNPSDTSV